MTFQEALAADEADRSLDDAAAASAQSRHETVAGCALVAAICAAFAGAAPTGTSTWDVLLRAGLAIAFTVAAALGPRATIIGAAVLAAMFVGITPWLIVAVIGLALGQLSYVRPQYQHEVHAGAALFTFQALLHLRPVGFFGLPSLLAGIAVVAVLVGGYRAAQPATQRRIRRGLAGLALVVGVALVVGAYSAVTIRNNADEGVAAARRGLAAARAGDTASLTGQLEQAEAKLAVADDQLRSARLKPLSLIPVVAQHHRSLGTATAQGAIVAREAATVARDANVDQLELTQGQFDLDLLSSMATPLADAVEALDNAVAAIEADRSPWLVAPVDDQLGELIDEVIDVLPEARVSAHAARVMPSMLGIDGERRYLMLFGSPGESREFGGFVGGYALLGIDQGELELIETGSTTELLFRARQGELDHPDGYPAEYLAVDPAEFPQNFTSTPNVELIARGVRDVFPELAGAPIDGIIYADPYALAAMTEFTGPVVIEGVEAALDQESLLQFIFEDQYRLFDSRFERFSAIGRLAAATAASFERASLPGPERLGEVLGPIARAGRLQIVTYDDDENAFLGSVLLQRNFSAPDPQLLDAFAAVQTNGTQSKLDLYLHREIDYGVTLDGQGGLQAVATVRLRSEIPADAPELTIGNTDGTNQVLLSLYSAHELTRLSVNGQPHEYVTREEFGFFRYALFKVPIPPNETATVRFELSGAAPEGEYRVAVWHQPLVNNDQVRLTLSEPGRQDVSIATELTENWVVTPREE